MYRHSVACEFIYNQVHSHGLAIFTLSHVRCSWLATRCMPGVCKVPRNKSILLSTFFVLGRQRTKIKRTMQKSDFAPSLVWRFGHKHFNCTILFNEFSPLFSFSVSRTLHHNWRLNIRNNWKFITKLIWPAKVSSCSFRFISSIFVSGALKITTNLYNFL